jgi:hypothetical protein
MEPNGQDSLKREALEFYIREWKRLQSASEDIDQQIELIEKQIIENGGAVPDSPGELQHYIIKALNNSFRLVAEPELIKMVLEVIPDPQRPQKNRNGTPESQVSKSISMSCRTWQDRPTRLFRCEGYVGLYEWKAPIGRLLEAATPKAVTRNEAGLVLQDGLGQTGPVALGALLESLIKVGLFQETDAGLKASGSIVWEY